VTAGIARRRFLHYRQKRVKPAEGISGVVLAGGQSRRIGTDKALLPILGKPLIVRAVTTLAELSDDLLVVTSSPARYEELGLPARIVADDRPGYGSLMGVYTGLKQARHPHALVVACDMPFLSLPLLRYMISLAAGHDVVIPGVDDTLEPLHAIYGKGCLGPIERQLEAGERRIVRFLPEVIVRVVGAAEIDRLDPQRLSFLNVNTPEDWSKIQELASTGSSSPR